jgi:hypothetical protein
MWIGQRYPCITCDSDSILHVLGQDEETIRQQSVIRNSLRTCVKHNRPTDPQGVNIWLTFSLKDQTNITINLAQEVEM